MKEGDFISLLARQALDRKHPIWDAVRLRLLLLHCFLFNNFVGRFFARLFGRSL